MKNDKHESYHGIGFYLVAFSFIFLQLDTISLIVWETITLTQICLSLFYCIAQYRWQQKRFKKSNFEIHEVHEVHKLLLNLVSNTKISETKWLKNIQRPFGIAWTYVNVIKQKENISLTLRYQWTINVPDKKKISKISGTRRAPFDFKIKKLFEVTLMMILRIEKKIHRQNLRIKKKTLTEQKHQYYFVVHYIWYSWLWLSQNPFVLLRCS